MKKIFLTLSIAVFASLANASYLYWQLDTGDTDAYQAVRLNTDQGEGDNYVTLLGVSWNGTEYVTSQATSVAPNATYLIDSEDLTDSYEYYVEYQNSEGNWVKYSNNTISGEELTTTYAQAAATSSESIADNSALAVVWHVSTDQTSVIPEPTSALLMLFGAAFLGLKRKNRSIA